jgi:integrase
MNDSDRKPARRQRVERNIYRRADGTLELGYRDSTGKQRWKALPNSYGIKAARAARDDILARRGRGEKVLPSPKLTFGQAAERWWTAQASKLRPTTQSAYSASRKHLAREWETTRLDNISVGMVARFVAEMEERGYRGWTIRGHLTVLGRVFDYAIRHLGFVGTNPVRQLERGERPRSDEREKRILSAEEVTRLLAAVDPPYRLLFAFTAATGVRLGEVLGLRWSSLDLARGTVHLSHQLGRKGTYSKLKTPRSRRTLELPASLVHELRAHKLATPHSGEHDFVFANRCGKGLDHRTSADESWVEQSKWPASKW